MKIQTIRMITPQSGPSGEPVRFSVNRTAKRLRRLVPLVLLLTIAATLMTLDAGCSEGSRRYEAEKALFEARKMREQIAAMSPRPEFVDKTVGAYRAIVDEYAGDMERAEDLAEIVISAQMELAELEFRTGRFDAAIVDFEKAYSLAKEEPAARANALYSTAFIAETMEDAGGALERYERFHREFLGEESVEATARMNTRYLITPLKLADLNARAGNEEKTRLWLDEAERIYRSAIEGAAEPAVVKEMRFNLLTTFLKGERWNKAHALIGELKRSYDNERDLPALLFLEAAVYRDGFRNTSKAIEILKNVYEQYPESPEAVSALMTAGGMQFEAGRYDEARRLFQSVIDTHADTDAQIAEATWQLARIEEAQGKWVDASLHYKLIYTRYPGTIQGLEAPLRIANHYRDRNEHEVASSAYQRAVEHYENLVSSQISEEVRLLAEEYVIRAFVEQGKWREAAGRLIELPDKYPNYAKFRGNYLKAASIHERELNDKKSAAEILETCMNRYPGTDLAAEAEKQHKRIKGAR
jgi:TolA-binding protein